MTEIKKEVIDKFKISAEFIRNKLGTIPQVAIIAGSGVGDALKNNVFLKQIDYSEIPNFPKVTVSGHSGKLVQTVIAGNDVLVFLGRFHHYEGKSIDEVLSIILLIHCLNIKNVVVSNAAGGLNSNFYVGDLMFINDTINFAGLRINSLIENNNISPIRSESNWQNRTMEKMISDGNSFRVGTYLMVTGPAYETRSEIGMMRKIGADAVGMSTVPEILLAKSLNMETIAFSLITNLAKEVTNEVSHQEVLDVADLSKIKIYKLLENAVQCL